MANCDYKSIGKKMRKTLLRMGMQWSAPFTAPLFLREFSADFPADIDCVTPLFFPSDERKYPKHAHVLDKYVEYMFLGGQQILSAKVDGVALMPPMTISLGSPGQPAVATFQPVGQPAVPPVLQPEVPSFVQPAAPPVAQAVAPPVVQPAVPPVVVQPMTEAVAQPAPTQATGISPEDMRLIIEQWPKLSAPIKEAIMSMIRTA